jgi:hypothetical protein
MSDNFDAAPAQYRSDDPRYRSKLGEFDKLTTINYPQWSSIIEFCLTSINAWDIVQGNEVRPPAGNTAAARAATADYTKRYGEAAGAIRLSCSNDVAPYLQGVRDPQTMWTILHDQFNHARHTLGRNTILNDFQNSRPKDGGPIAVYFGRLKQFQEKLAGTPEAITDRTMKTHIFSTLPREFDVQKQVLELQPEDNLTIQTVMDAMKNYEMRHLETLRRLAKDTSVSENNTAATSGAALQAAAAPQRCTYCRKNGHDYKSCFRRRKRNRGDNLNDSTAGANSILCYYCGERGHIRRICPVTKKAKQARLEEDNSQAGPSKAKGEEQKSTANATACLAIGESDDLEPY